MLEIKQLMKTNTTPYFHIRLPGTFKLYPQLDAKVTEIWIFFPPAALFRTQLTSRAEGSPSLSNLPFLLKGFQQHPCATGLPPKQVCLRSALNSGLISIHTLCLSSGPGIPLLLLQAEQNCQQDKSSKPSRAVSSRLLPAYILRCTETS